VSPTGAFFKNNKPKLLVHEAQATRTFGINRVFTSLTTRLGG